MLRFTATPAQLAFRRQVLHPLKLRLVALTPEAATVTIRYKYLTQNPFRSIYFAALGMAAELASGMLASLHTQGSGPVSMLVVGLQAEFTKKAVGLIAFTCPDGAALAAAVAESRATGQGRTVVCTSTGRDEAGDVVAVFRVTWSFKAK
ncbi:MAG: DUF4442 domain-containing protein [Hymenobacter sp.]|nr:MAG: DUF4442 domain-containing protein [Hymenobacter sp.]